MKPGHIRGPFTSITPSIRDDDFPLDDLSGDLAKELRNELIAAANGRVIGIARETSTLESSDHSMLSQFIAEPVALESEKSADELEQDIGEGPSLSQGCLREDETNVTPDQIRANAKKASQEMMADLVAAPFTRRMDKAGNFGPNNSSRSSIVATEYATPQVGRTLTPLPLAGIYGVQNI